VCSSDLCIHNVDPYLTLWVSRPTAELIGAFWKGGHLIGK
jgi:hypothetical protein